MKTRLMMMLIVLVGFGFSPDGVFAQARQAQAKPKVLRDIEYARVGDLPLRLDLYLPTAESDKKPSLVVWIHGGGWRAGSKNRCPWVWLTQHGFAVASVQYRLTDKAIFPAQIHDCKGAIRWLRANSAKYGYDASRVGAIGISAGGHLVSMLATTGGVKALEGDVGGNLDQSSRVQAVVNMCGPSDFLLRNKQRPDEGDNPRSPINLLFGGPVSEKMDLAKLASPTAHVGPGDAPLIIVHGEADALVHVSQSEHFHEKYKEAELDVKLVIIPDGKHVPKEFFDAERRKMIHHFFKKHLQEPAVEE